MEAVRGILRIFSGIAHSNETSSAVLSHGTIYVLVFYKMIFGIRLQF